VKHIWRPVRRRFLRMVLGLRWQCRLCGKLARRRSYRPECPQLKLVV
jgi:ribosomal protein L37AE/L43A